MRSFAQELEELRTASLRRSLRHVEGPQQPRVTVDGQAVVNFSSNDYLGLASAPEVKEAFIRGVEKWGAGSGASRLVCGTQSPHAALEEALADFKGTEAALTFSSGYAAAVGTLTSLLGPGDTVILDKLCHASLIDGARLSGATLRVFPHNRTARLAEILQSTRPKVPAEARILVVTESVFSMDGDRAPLTELAAVAAEYGALLMVDEAHAFGICGRQGRGLADECGIRPDIQMGTLSKAAGLQGGYICGSRGLVDLLINRARSFIYSTAPPPALAAAALCVVRDILPGPDGEARRARMWENVRNFAGRLALEPPKSAILPVIVGGEEEAMQHSRQLLEAGFLVPAIRFPTVARGSARLRVTFSAAHTAAEVADLAQALKTS